jgi:protein-disulfide isomerase
MSPWIDRLTDAATVLVGACAVVVTGVVVSRELSGERDSTPPPGNPVLEVVEDWRPIAAEGHRLGPAEAAVTIVEFGDYGCSFCRDAARHLTAILREHREDVALVYRHLPLIDQSPAHLAAIAAECAGEQGAFWTFHDLLYRSSAWLYGSTSQVLVEMAAPADVPDIELFKACVGREGPVPAIAADLTTASDAGFRGTPTFLVNGRKYMGVLDSLEFGAIYEDLRR